jgi:hypothetical protein
MTNQEIIDDGIQYWTELGIPVPDELNTFCIVFSADDVTVNETGITLQLDGPKEIPFDAEDTSKVPEHFEWAGIIHDAGKFTVVFGDGNPFKAISKEHGVRDIIPGVIDEV